MPNPSPAPTRLRTVRTFLRTGTCSATLFNVLNRSHGEPMAVEERASDPLAGGIMMHGYQCGQLWGAALAAGAEAHRRFGAGALSETKAILATREATTAFTAQNGHTDCYEITGLARGTSKLRLLSKLVLKGGPVHCFAMAARYAPAALAAIDRALSEPQEPGCPAAGPVSCASMAARRMGAGDRDAVTVAGLAGGIGLSGGGCGALGAAIWLSGLVCLRRGVPKIGFRDPAAEALVERFLSRTKYEFECSAIVGRRFESVADHAEHVRGGGCSAILDALGAR